MMAAAMGGCMSTSSHGPVAKGPEANPGPTIRASGQFLPQTVPGAVGPYGEPVQMAAPYNTMYIPPSKARQMMTQSVPLDMVNMDPSLIQAAAQMPGGGMGPGGMMAPPGMPMAPGGMPGSMPGGMGMPGGMPGMGMPGMGMPGGMPSMPMNGPMAGSNMITPPRGLLPGMTGMPPGAGGMAPPGSMQFMPGGPFPGSRPPGAVAALGAITGPGYMPQGQGYKIGRTQVRFNRPIDMKVGWLTQGPEGKPVYSEPVIFAPGRYNYLQASIYALKLSNIEGRPGVQFYPTLEVVPCNPKTEAFLAHSAVPLDFTPEDFQEVSEGKYLVKVIYLPDPQFQEIAAGPEEIVSTRLEPGADPIMEAQRRGSILLVIRMGNVDQEAPNTPPLQSGPSAPNNGGPGMGMMPGGPGGPGSIFGRPGAGPGAGGPTTAPTGPTTAPLPPSVTPPLPGLPGGSTSQLPDMPPVRAAGTPTQVSLPPMPPSPSELAGQGGAKK
jgi:hypothetical protein